jgi:hypothetical protein
MLEERGSVNRQNSVKIGPLSVAVQKQYVILKKLPPMTLLSSIKKRLGDIRKISFAKNRLKQGMLKNPFKSAEELKKEVPGLDKISVHMIQHVLQKQLGLPFRVTAKKPMLTQTMVKKHLKFCHK